MARLVKAAKRKKIPTGFVVKDVRVAVRGEVVKTIQGRRKCEGTEYVLISDKNLKFVIPENEIGEYKLR